LLFNFKCLLLMRRCSPGIDNTSHSKFCHL
jgi:hypothetical protein